MKSDVSRDRILCIFLGLCTTIPAIKAEKPPLFLKYEWTQLEYDYTESERQHAIQTREFIPGAAAPIDVDVFYSGDQRRDKIFISSPRIANGIAATLGTITNRTFNGDPIISPYPSWSWQTQPKTCKQNRIVSVFRTAIDECNRLWVMDDGKVAGERTCPPQILAFDLTTDQVIVQHDIPDVEDRSTFVTPVVEVLSTYNQCRNTFVYMADCNAFALHVFDLNKKRSWKIVHKSFYPDPEAGTYQIAGESFDLMDGILGMSLRGKGPDTKLYYHAMSGFTENWVSTKYLQDESRFRDNPESSPEIFNTFRNKKRTQTAAEGIDRNGVMFFGLMSDISLNCWNTNSEFGERSFGLVQQNYTTLQFLSGLKVISGHKYGDEIWVLSSRFQAVSNSNLFKDKTNFRIMAGFIKDQLVDTKCRTSFGGGHGLGGGYGFHRPPLHQYPNKRSAPL